MPIHLPPISRRRFLLRTMAGAAGLALARRSFADSWTPSGNSWALLADTHVAADRAMVSRNANMAEHLETVSRELIALAERPTGVFVLGDCAFGSGETADYETLGGLLEGIRRAEMPIHLALGNHDHRQRFREALQKGNQVAGPVPDKHVAMIASKQVNWFMLDSLETTLSTPGLLGPGQLAWLGKVLDAENQTPAVVLVHHNPGTSERIQGLKDTADLMNVLRPRKQVKALIFGHTHFWNVSQDESGIHLINLPPVAYVFRETNPSGWVHARIEPEGMTLELRCVKTDHAAHGQKLDLKWRAARSAQ